jgi:hypothetical protein
MEKKRLVLRIPASLMDLLVRRSRDEGISRNELVINILALYFEKDITDESLLIAKLSDLQRSVQLLDRKVDVAQKLQLEWFQHYFLSAPPLPSNDKEAALLFRAAAERTDAFLSNFRRRLPKLPALLESLLADFLEEDA